jgi:hypothetical protein
MSHENNRVATEDLNEAKQVWGQPPSAVPPDKARQFAMLRAVATSAVISTILSIAAFAQSGAPAKLTEDLPPGPMQAKAIAACQECHEARIMLQQRLSKAAWAKEVDKMIKWGAVVDASDHDPLIDYLSSNFGVDESPYAPPRSSGDKTRAGKSK